MGFSLYGFTSLYTIQHGDGGRSAAYAAGQRNLRTEEPDDRESIRGRKRETRLRYTQFRGKARVKMQVLLTFACMNLKKLTKWKKKSGLLREAWRDLFYFFVARHKISVFS
jgi:hypothetical protein